MSQPKVFDAGNMIGRELKTTPTPTIRPTEGGGFSNVNRAHIDALVAHSPQTTPESQSEPKADTAPKKRRKRALKPIEIPYSLGTLELINRVKLTAYCSHAGCRAEFVSRAAEMDKKLNALLDSGRISWTMAMHEDGGIGLYCFAHEAPEGSQPVKLAPPEEF